MNNTIKLIKERRTTRKFKSEKVSKEHLEAIVEAGIYAPSGHNRQPWHFTVIQNSELLAELNFEGKEAAKSYPDELIQRMANNEQFNLFYHAPAVVVVSGDEQLSTTREDCAAGTQNMLLAAESLGVGACWVGMITMLFRGEKATDYKTKLGIPEGYSPLYAVALGHKDMTGSTAPARKENTVNFIL